mmetsp:Transcript_48231/g.77248  ORF Transcript_48231/g.77248 Transcript_48231/m.77248 type:complete len:85 (+) Transcript_48231:3-257(+)
MHNFLKAGLCHFDVIEQDAEKKEAFITWILTEMKKHNVPVSSQTRRTLTAHKVDIIDHSDYADLIKRRTPTTTEPETETETKSE